MTHALRLQAGSPLARAISAIYWVMANRASAFARAIKHRHDAQMLANLDDRMLSDIGVTRSDLRDAYAEPLWRDPTVILADRAGERRANRRRLVFNLASSPPLAPETGCNVPPTSRPARFVV